MTLTALAADSAAPRGDLHRWAKSFRRSLGAASYSEKTIEVYLGTVEKFGAFLADETNRDDDGRTLPLNVADIRADHVRMFLAAETARGMSKATVNQRYRSLHAFFKYVEEETTQTKEIGPIITSPMGSVKAPKLDERLVPVLEDDVVQRLIDSCKGNTFEGLRDTAILRLFSETPVRRSEVVSMTVDRTDLDRMCAKVIGKGDVEREVYFSAKTVKAIERYLRWRDRHLDADSPALWLGRRGPLKSDGIRQMLERRGRDIGVHVHAHQFRHTFAHNWLVDGGQEQVLMMFTGWKNRSMVDHYAKSAARARAEKAYRRQRPGDRFK